MKKISTLLLSAVFLFSCQNPDMEISGESNLITAIGRYENSPEGVKMYSAGGYFTFAFEGNSCEIQINNAGDYDHSFFEIAVDDIISQNFRAERGITKIVIGEKGNNTDSTKFFFETLPNTQIHNVVLCRNSETMMGYTQIKTIKAQKIYNWTPKTNLKIEFIGNSITSGCDSDSSLVSSKDYKWGDWHRAYYAYGPQTARNLNAQYSLASVSGIGLVHSCCDIPFTMPQIYDKVLMRYDTIQYDFSFNPDLICCALGQNDGIQDDEYFINAYTDFVKLLFKKNPSAKNIVLLNSPMANDSLDSWLKKVLPQVVDRLSSQGINNVTHFEFSHNKNAGGSNHPDIYQHQEVAKELTEFLKERL